MSKLKPYNKYQPVTYDYVAELPEGWQLLPNLAIFQERKELGGEDLESLSVSAIRGIVRMSDNGGRKDRTSEDKSNYLVVHEGDIPYNTMLMWAGAVGSSAFHGIVSPAYTVLRAKHNVEINSKYFHYMFRSQFYRDYAKRFSYGIVDSRLRLYYTYFKRMYSIFPPLETQNEIVSYLDRKTKQIQEFIQKKERLLELLEQERKELIDIYIHDLDALEVDSKPLKYLVKLISEQTNKREDDEIYIALENIESWTGKIDLSIGDDTFDSTVRKFEKTDILFSKLRPYLAKVVIPETNGVCVGEILIFRPSKEILKELLYYNLISKRFIDLVDSSTFGSKMPRANWDFIGKINISFPVNLSEQHKIVQEIKVKEKSIFSLKEKIKSEIIQIEEYQESLITQVVTGQLKVPAVVQEAILN